MQAPARPTLPGLAGARMHRARFRPAVWLALLLFALRAWLPAGFMPDPGALRGGHFEITFCTSAGTMRMPFDLAAGHGKSGIPDTGASDCPFGLAGAHPLILPAAPALILARIGYWRPRHIGAAPVVSRMRVHSPPVGSRAPPIDL